MSKRIVIDPVTRIEGHLRVEVIVEDGKVVDAWTKGTMFRGLEQIIQGRDPRDAVYITERVCGVCMASHGWTSAMAVETAHGANVPTAARLIRNLLVGALWLHDHPLHFYHLSALDYLDILAVKDYQGNDARLIGVKERIMKLVDGGDTAPLFPRYEPDEFSVTDPEIVTTVLSHYLQALQIQAKAKKMSAVLGGKQPHQSSIIVGGVTVYPTAENIKDFRRLLTEVVHFIRTVYVPDVVSFATGPLLPLAKSGFGQGPGNYLAYGGFNLDDSGKEKLFKGGFIQNNRIENIEKFDESLITEAVTNSWYRAAAPVHPWNGTTDVNLDKQGAYTFIKAPRYKGLPAEVGPLARMLVYGYRPFKELVEKYEMKFGAVTRHLARAQEALIVCDAMFKWVEELEALLATGRVNIHDANSWEPPVAGKGAGLTEAPRGALGHWVQIEDKKVKNYQMVVPTTWNVSPRDDKNIRGPLEQALIGITVDENNPVNVVRVIRSFDPCLACAVHVIGSNSEKMIQI
ncbi:MAG: nickel-dependent hydrogenase large subunit [Clostridia bacterium]|nr:nickel-dependent hydrogenase large subunit [Clostridia bacterium]